MGARHTHETLLLVCSIKHPRGLHAHIRIKGVHTFMSYQNFPLIDVGCDMVIILLSNLHYFILLLLLIRVGNLSLAR